MASSDSEIDGVEQSDLVRISLKLSQLVKDRSLEVSTEPIAVPANIGRKGLSTALNHLLGRSVTNEKNSDDDGSTDGDTDNEKLPAISFEFIVEGTGNRLLRKGVEREARQHGLSLEEAISITYFPATNLPQRKDDEETMPDWVSCLSYCNTHGSYFAFSGCYDGSIHAFKREKNNSLTKLDFAAVGTAGPIKAMATSHIDNKVWIATASLDHSLTIHSFENTDGNGKGTLQSYGKCVQTETELGSLSSAFTSLDFSSTKILASGNGAGKISLWNIKNVHDDESTTNDKKRQKTSKCKMNTKSSSDKDITAIVHFENSHSQSVTEVSWGNHNIMKDNGISGGAHLISGSWDHAIKYWDVEKENCLLTLNGARVVSCLDTSYHSEGIVATGHPDCTIRLWDVRTNNTKQNVMLSSNNTFRPSHKSWISSVKWSQTNAYQLASISHDSSIKIWDIRSSNPLHTVKIFSKEAKGLSLLWLPSTALSHEKYRKSNQVIYAGGTDCIIKRLEI